MDETYYVMVLNSDQGVIEPGAEVEGLDRMLKRARVELLAGYAVDIHPESHCAERGCDH